MDGARRLCKQFTKIICIYQIKVVTLHTILKNKLRFDTLRSDCAGCFVVYLDKKIVHFTKNQLFFEKKSGKNLHMSKKSSTFAPDLEKETNLNGHELGIRP